MLIIVKCSQQASENANNALCPGLKIHKRTPQPRKHHALLRFPML